MKPSSISRHEVPYSWKGSISAMSKILIFAPDRAEAFGDVEIGGPVVDFHSVARAVGAAIHQALARREQRSVDLGVLAPSGARAKLEVMAVAMHRSETIDYLGFVHGRDLTPRRRRPWRGAPER
jgi:hypothetical protein